MLSEISTIIVGDMKSLTMPTVTTALTASPTGSPTSSTSPTASPTKKVAAEKVEAVVDASALLVDPPIIGGIYPELVPFGGGVNVTLKGKNLGQIRSITVTDFDGGETPINGEPIFQPSLTSDQQKLEFTLPNFNSSGYHLVKFTSVTGAVGNHTIFAQRANERQECSLEGEWKWDEEAQSCLPCPQSSHCPGGGRVWPRAG